MDWNSLSNSMLIDIDRGFLIARLKLSINCCKKDRFFESNLQRKFFGKEIVDIIFNRCISEDMVVFDWLSSNCQNGLAFFRSFCSLLTSENQATLFPHWRTVSANVLAIGDHIKCNSQFSEDRHDIPVVLGTALHVRRAPSFSHQVADFFPVIVDVNCAISGQQATAGQGHAASSFFGHGCGAGVVSIVQI